MRKESGKIAGVLTLVTVLLVSVATLFAFSLGRYEKVKASGDEVSIATSRVSDGKAHYYKYVDKGKEIAFFIAKAADGSYKAAFDACDSCYKSKKGYEQQGDKMNCKNCNQKFAIAKLGPNATGGCNPGYLPSRIIGGNVVIKVDDINSGAKYF